ncbi:MAG: nucleoside transporter C-terminal domain-containing protein [Pseudomonadota bacterium]
MSDFLPRLTAFVGLFALIGIAWLCSSDRSRFPWRVVVWGVGIQFVIGVFLLVTGVGQSFFIGMSEGVTQLLGFVDKGSRFLFGPLMDTGFSFALNVLPGIIMLGAIFQVLYHWGVAQFVVRLVARGLSRAMGVSGVESLAAAANIFVGQTEAPLLVKPFIERMTASELFSLMTVGMATVAGSVMLAYTQMLGTDFAGHLITASLMSAPAALLIAKIMVPETGQPLTLGNTDVHIERTTVNAIDAAAEGALSALRLAANIGALLIAFVALVELVNAALGAVGALVGQDNWSLQRLLGAVLAPFVWLMGIPWQDAQEVGSLVGIKTVANEFVAYVELGDKIAAGAISERSAVIASYALCGFANFSSIAILIGGIGGMAPGRRSEIAQFGLRAVLAGTLATHMTGCIVAMLWSPGG